MQWYRVHKLHVSKFVWNLLYNTSIYVCDVLIVVEPTAFQLISTFLEKAGAVEGQVCIAAIGVHENDILD